MKSTFKLFLSAAVLILSAMPAFASSELEKDFVDRYKKAFESNDSATLEGFLYAKNADPDALEFYKLMMTSDVGSKISSIELIPLTEKEAKEASGVIPALDGSDTKLPVAPTRKLVLKIESSDANSSSHSTSQSFVAEVDGKLMIPVPVKSKR